MENVKFYNDAPMLKYCEKLLNRCCFSILASAFGNIEQTKAVNAISLRIEEFLKSKMCNHIDFDNAILKNENKLKVNQECIIARGKKINFLCYYERHK